MHETKNKTSECMKVLLKEILKLKHNEVKVLVDKRMKQFNEMNNKPRKEIFKELCFCILCANYTAEGSIRVQKEIDDGFLTLSEPNLAERLRSLGYRFPNIRAKFIVEARRLKDSLLDTVYTIDDESKRREWLIQNVKGIGPKEASHFLRNIGYTNYAIIDFHIIDSLIKYGLIEEPKTFTKRRYYEIENLLKEIAENAKLNLAELDLYLWYMETNKVLK